MLRYITSTVILLTLSASGLAAMGTIVVDGTTCTLTDAILAANSDAPVGGCTGASGVDTLTLNADVVLTSADTTNSSSIGGSFAGLPDVTSTLILEAGTGSEVSRDLALVCTDTGVGHFRLFNVTANASLTLDGITLRNGCAANGGAVFIAGDGQLIVGDSSFLGNTAQSSTDPVASGGALFFVGSSAFSSIQGSLLQGNEARSPTGSATGGAIFTDIFSTSLTQISETDFIANRAIAGTSGASSSALGGAINGWNVLTVSDSTFVQNEALAQGLGASALGGGVLLSGNTEVFRTIFRENLARGGPGGLGDSGGYLGTPFALEDCLFEANRSEGGNNPAGDGGDATAGGASIFGGIVRRTTFVGNVAAAGNSDLGTGGMARGGGMYWDASVDMSQATLSENQALGGDSSPGDGGAAIGGGVFHRQGLPIVHHLTAVGNLARGGAGSLTDGAASAGGLCIHCVLPASLPIVFDNNLLAGNLAQDGAGAPVGSDCEGGTGVASSGFNLAETPGTCNFGGPNDQVGIDPMVLALMDDGCTNMLPGGGCVPVHPLSPSSPALDAGSCTSSGATEDARGSTRPFDDPTIANVDDGCDIGAYELGPVNLFSDGFESGDTIAWTLTVP